MQVYSIRFEYEPPNDDAPYLAPVHAKADSFAGAEAQAQAYIDKSGKAIRIESITVLGNMLGGFA